MSRVTTLAEKAKNPFRPKNRKWVNLYALMEPGDIRGLGEGVDGISYVQEAMYHDANLDIADIERAKIKQQGKYHRRLAGLSVLNKLLGLRRDEAQGRAKATEAALDEWEQSHSTELGRQVNRATRFVVKLFVRIVEGVLAFLAAQVFNATQTETILIGLGLSTVLILTTDYVAHRLATHLSGEKRFGFVDFGVWASMLAGVFGILWALAEMRRLFLEIVTSSAELGLPTVSSFVLFMVGAIVACGAIAIELLWHNSVADEADRRARKNRRARAALAVHDFAWTAASSLSKRTEASLATRTAIAEASTAERLSKAHLAVAEHAAANHGIYGLRSTVPPVQTPINVKLSVATPTKTASTKTIDDGSKPPAKGRRPKSSRK